MVIWGVAWAQEPGLVENPERLEPGAVVLAAYNGDLGVGVGGVLNLARFNSAYTPYRWRIQLLLALFAKSNGVSPVGTFQNSRFVMADARTKLDVGWAYLDHCAMAHIDGECTAEMAAQAKLFTSEIEGEIIDACLQLHGGAGYMEEYEISRLYVDARISRIYAGTSEIMREIIGRGLGLDDRQKS